MAKVKLHIRECSYRIRQGKDGPVQYARVVCHAEIPDRTTKNALDAITDDQKGGFVADLEVEEPELPLKAGMQG